MAKKPSTPKSVETVKPVEAKRKNVPTAECQSGIGQAQRNPNAIRYPRGTNFDRRSLCRERISLVVDLYDAEKYAGSRNYYTPQRPLTVENKLGPPVS